MTQSRAMSALEVCLNVGSGLIIAMLTWQFVITPLFNIQVPVSTNAFICAIFTLVSVVRSYLWRRAFNYLHTPRATHEERSMWTKP